MKANKLTPQEIFEKAISGKEITPEEREVLRRTLSTPFYPDSLSGNEKLKNKEENKARVGTKVSSTLGGYIPNVVKQELTQAKSGIHIKPENKGKFTASAKRAGMGVQEFASHVLANKDDYSSTQVKRANFARNASKWKHQDGGDIMSADSTKYFSNSNRDEYQNGGYLPVYKTRNGKQPEIPKKKKVIPNSRLMQSGGYSWGTGGYEAPTAKVQNTESSSVKVTKPSYNIKDKVNLETEAINTINDIYSHDKYKQKLLNEYLNTVSDNPDYKNIQTFSDLYNARLNNIKNVNIDWNNTTDPDRPFTKTLGEYIPVSHRIRLNKDITANSPYSFNMTNMGGGYDKNAYNDYIDFLYDSNQGLDVGNKLKKAIHFSPAYNTLAEELAHASHYGDADTYLYKKHSVPSRNFSLMGPKRPYDKLRNAYNLEYINSENNSYWSEDDKTKRSGRLNDVINTRITPSALKTMSENLKSKDKYITHPSEFIAKKTTTEAFLINTGQMKLGENFSDQNVDYLLNNYWDLPVNVKDFIDAFLPSGNVNSILKDKEKVEDIKKRMKTVSRKIATTDIQEDKQYAQRGGSINRNGRVISADSVVEYDNGSREYNNYQEGGYADKYQDRLDQYIREGLYPQEQPTMYDQSRSPLDYGINKQLGNFSTKAGAYMDMMNSNPGMYGSVGFNKGKFNSNVEHKRGIGNKSTNVDMSYFGDKFNAGINYSNDSFMGKRFGASAGYNSPNTSVDVSYFNNNGQPEINANVGFRKGNFNSGIGYSRHAGQNHLQGNVGYSNKDYDVNLSGNYSPEHSEFNAGVNYRLGNRKVQKQDPIQLSQEVIDELDVISGKKPVESNEAAYPVEQLKEGKMGGSLTCHKCGGYTHMQTGGRACGCRHKRK